MMLDDVLGRTAERVATVSTSTARSASDLVAESAVEATGSAQRFTEKSAKSPALAAAFLALASLGGLVAMRKVFAGAIS